MDEIKISVDGRGITHKPAQLEQIKQISGKLHPEKDQDIIREIRKTPKRERSKLYRDALRYYFRSQIYQDFRGMK